MTADHSFGPGHGAACHFPLIAAAPADLAAAGAAESAAGAADGGPATPDTAARMPRPDCQYLRKDVREAAARAACQQ